MPETVWDIIEFVELGMGDCNNCGQEKLPTMPFCKMCDKHMNTVVLPICRSFLAKNKNDIVDLKSQTEKDMEKMQDKSKLREVAIGRILDRFPFELAAKTSKFKKILDAEGVWFAHINSYLMIKNLRPIGTKIHDLVKDPLYKMMRKEFYDFLHKGEKFLDKDKRETIMNVYRLPKATLDGSKVIISMIQELEQQEKIQIYREKNKCVKCGKECESGLYCTECEDEEMLKRRQAISANMPAPILQPQQPSSPRSTGMHLKKDSDT